MADVGRLVREEGDPLNILYLTSSDVIDVTEIYRSTLDKGLFLYS